MLSFANVIIIYYLTSKEIFNMNVIIAIKCVEHFASIVLWFQFNLYKMWNQQCGKTEYENTPTSTFLRCLVIFTDPMDSF